MAKVEFARDYDHPWASGAVTAFRAGWSGTVKAEVQEAAERAGVLVGPKPTPHTARKRGRPPTAKPVTLPPADDPAAIVREAPGADGDPVPLNTHNDVDASRDSQ